MTNRTPERSASPSAGSAESVLGNDPRILGQPGNSEVTVVEFLDFECEACGAFFPVVKQLRKDYAGEVTFAIRYFPLPGHRNSRTAAAAVEAASRQGKLEAMSDRLFTDQKQWAERGSQSQAALFRQYAVDLGLDMAKYDAAVTSASVKQRIQRDFDAGNALGVTSTPTFFINGKALELTAYTDVERGIEAALAKKARS